MPISKSAVNGAVSDFYGIYFWIISGISKLEL